MAHAWRPKDSWLPSEAYHRIERLRSQVRAGTDRMIRLKREADHWQQAFEDERLEAHRLRERIGQLEADAAIGHASDELIGRAADACGDGEVGGQLRALLARRWSERIRRGEL